MKKKALSILFWVAIIFGCTNRDGEIIDLISSVKKQNDDLKAQITGLKKTTDSAMVAITKVTVSQSVTDKKIDVIQADLKAVLAQISSLSNQMTASNADLASIKTKIDALQVKCAELVAQIALLNTSLIPTLKTELLAYFICNSHIWRSAVGSKNSSGYCVLCSCWSIIPPV
jgi:peptidoglycan hydrolase CwlO-like protein